MPIIPPDNPNLHCQIVPSPVTDEAFHDAWYPKKITFLQRIGQVLLFIFTFGWLRFTLAISGTIIYMILILPVVIFVNNEKVIAKLTGYGVFISRCYIRWLCLCFGIVWIQKVGQINQYARNYVYNHTSALDGPLVYILRPFAVVGHIGIKNVFFFGRIITASQAVYVDRSRTSGNSQFIRERMEDHSKAPIAIAPEGKISNGTILFKFRTGGFIANEPIQPVTIRYHQCYNICGCTYNWLQDSALDWIWSVLCIPFSYVTISFLDTMQPEDFEGLTPEKKAEVCQINMANNLGSLAINRSAREIFAESNTPETHPT